ncbi:ATP-dependent helicase [Desulfovibrio inopinatus]|uniref:ATP-dependent helicase n=1 Tax=Desulfovibrio inopinatus TaxID=102109 RepID=UPI0004064BD5|nr:ATP-dependent helicase [Desulfovibrio inopinatus]
MNTIATTETIQTQQSMPPQVVTLNAQQREAVTVDQDKHRQVLVLAGAGSGKTRVLTERIAHLIEDCKVHPSEIVAITFTRLAAKEMKERLEARLGKNAYGLSVSTMHGLAFRLLRQFGDLLGLRTDRFTVYSSLEEDMLLKDVAEEMGGYDSASKRWKVKRKDIAEAFAHYREHFQEPPADEPAANIVRGFYQRCRENNAVTHDGLMIGLRQLMPRIAQYLHWRYLLVDECQDLDGQQWMIVNDVMEHCGSALFAVGDIDQSIYEWRGAIPGYLVSQAEKFHILRLEQNYRNGRTIVDAANNLIDHNANRLPKTMVPARQEEGEIGLAEKTQGQGALFENVLHINLEACIVSQARDVKSGSLAVLCRTHDLLEGTSNELDTFGIKNIHVGSASKLQNSPEFMRIHAVLKLMINPFDNFSFMVIREYCDVSRETYAQIRINAAKLGLSHFQVWKQSVGFSPFAGLELVDDALNVAQDWFLPSSPVEMNFLESIVEQHDITTVSGLLEYLAFQDAQDDLSIDDETVPLMTVHAAKGLEWDNVVLIGFDDGVFPSKRNANIEEERRLAYVALTRAANSITIVHDQQKPSRFIAEMGA